MQARSRSLFEGQLIGPALRDSVRKLDPRTLARNPVMFLVEITAVVTLIFALTRDAATQQSFDLAISAWLWFTVLFANFAEAIAEGRGKAQADFLRKSKSETSARRLVGTKEEVVQAPELRRGDRIVITAGELIAADGDVVEGAG
jgi:K+-transporting ATPase ATPase B chain